MMYYGKMTSQSNMFSLKQSKSIPFESSCMENKIKISSHNFIKKTAFTLVKTNLFKLVTMRKENSNSLVVNQ